MAEIAYMIREDWAQEGAGMASNSALVRSWFCDRRFCLLVTDSRTYSTKRSADREAVEYIGAEDLRIGPISISDLPQLQSRGVSNISALAMHPYLDNDLKALRRAIDEGTVSRLFVMVWSPHEVIRLWLEAIGAVNLYTGCSLPSPDPVMVAAGRMMVSEEYNGLGSGNGKDTVVGLFRAFETAGYPCDEEIWARAFLAAGGSFRHLEAVRKFAREVRAGTRHRIRPRFRANIVDILTERAAAA